MDYGLSPNNFRASQSTVYITVEMAGITRTADAVILNSSFQHTRFNPEDGGDTFLRNAGNYLQDYKASQPRR
jgi:hypothetical protein